MITIDQLLESVDLDFEPRFVTKNKNGGIYVWTTRPQIKNNCWRASEESAYDYIAYIKLAEFDGKDWTECIYEVPRKTTRKIKEIILTPATTKNTDMFIVNKINELVDAVNELKGAKNE